MQNYLSYGTYQWMYRLLSLEYFDSEKNMMIRWQVLELKISFKQIYKYLFMMDFCDNS